MDVVDTGSSSAGTSARTALSDQIFAVLKEKPAPELCLDSQTLEVGEDHTVMSTTMANLSSWEEGLRGEASGAQKGKSV